MRSSQGEFYSNVGFWEDICFSLPARFVEEEKQSKKTGESDTLKSMGALGGYCLCFLNNGF